MSRAGQNKDVVRWENAGNMPERGDNAFRLIRIVNGLRDFVFVGYLDWKSMRFSAYPLYSLAGWQGKQDKVMLYACDVPKSEEFKE